MKRKVLVGDEIIEVDIDDEYNEYEELEEELKRLKYE